MNAIGQLLSVEDIVLDLDVPGRTRIFEEVGRLFEKRHGLAQKQVVESLSRRERLGSTGLGQGVALPHARVKRLQRAMAAFVRPKSPAAFDAPDGKPVSEILVLLVPEHASDQHLQLLAEVAQMFSDQGFRGRLRACTDAEAVRELFADWSPS